MAKFRMVYTEFWTDSDMVEDFTPEDRYFFLYLLTNPNTTQIGIYEITKKQIAFDMGYSIESINSLMDRFINHHKLIRYNPETRELAIKNWGKYNLNKGGKPVIDCIKSELKKVKDISLIKYVGERVVNHDIRIVYDTYHDTSTTRGQKEEEEKELKHIPPSGDGGACDNPKNNNEGAQLVSGMAGNGNNPPAEKSPTGEGAQSDTGKIGKDKVTAEKSSYTPEFKEFWANYPRKIEKRKAFRVWKTRIKEYSNRDIVLAAKNYSAFCKRNGIEQRFVKHPATFIGPDMHFLEFLEEEYDIESTANIPYVPADKQIWG